MSDCTRCSKDSLDLAGEDGADVPRDPDLKLRDSSPPLVLPLTDDAPVAGAVDPTPLVVLLILPPVAVLK